MHAWIALLRGINVNGKKIVPMATLRELFDSLGYADVRTYIQSGNVFFRSKSKSKPANDKLITAGLQSTFGFQPRVILLTAQEVQAAIENNPFAAKVQVPKLLHFYFLAATPTSPDLAALHDVATPTEEFQLIERVCYLHTPDGFGKSKLAERMERKLGVPATARNLSTVLKLAEMCEAV
ncbi:MAG: DUF1697 domain-containing protein [Planctomycetales bacterium]|nr:DUF1697 domain-containing protein [Planctomycetales bacterium]MCA9166806.1 DUF1697 domain-containing protein [Planctomycetales bacterium]